MPIQLRVKETRIARGYGDLTVEAKSPDQAAAMVARAHRRSVMIGSPVITLSDGQSLMIDMEPAETAIEVILLNDSGEEVGPIAVATPREVCTERG